MSSPPVRPPAPPPPCLPLPPHPFASSSTLPRTGGVALRWNAEKGFGFIRPHDGGQDLFCHVYDIEDGDALGEGFDVSFVRKYDDARGRANADQVSGGIGPRPGSRCDPLLTPCLPYGSEVLDTEGQPPRPVQTGKRTRDQAQQEAVDSSWLSLSAMVRSIGQAPLETRYVELQLSPGYGAGDLRARSPQPGPVRASPAPLPAGTIYIYIYMCAGTT